MSRLGRALREPVHVPFWLVLVVIVVYVIPSAIRSTATIVGWLT